MSVTLRIRRAFLHSTSSTRLSLDADQNALLISLFAHDRLQFADSMAVWAYAFGVTMAILIVLEPFMFLSRQRWLRGGTGWLAVTKPVVDRGTIREEIPMWELRRE